MAGFKSEWLNMKHIKAKCPGCSKQFIVNIEDAFRFCPFCAYKVDHYVELRTIAEEIAVKYDWGKNNG